MPLNHSPNETEEFEPCEQMDTAPLLADYVANYSPNPIHSPADNSGFVEHGQSPNTCTKKTDIKTCVFAESSTQYTYETKLGNTLCKLFGKNSKESILRCIKDWDFQLLLNWRFRSSAHTVTMVSSHLWFMSHVIVAFIFVIAPVLYNYTVLHVRILSMI